jgi:hypothetical protein
MTSSVCRAEGIGRRWLRRARQGPPGLAAGAAPRSRLGLVSFEERRVQTALQTPERP